MEIRDHIPNIFVNVGTNLYETYLSQYLDPTYFKSEPRTTIDWLYLIRDISMGMNTHGEKWNELLPNFGKDSLELIAEYIKHPKESIAAGLFTPEEIEELQQPHRILLFYFLKKISHFEIENPRIIRNTNNEIAENILKMKPKGALPDRGFAMVVSEQEVNVDIPSNTVLESIVENEPFTRVYQTKSTLKGQTMKLAEAYNAFLLRPAELGIQHRELPLTQSLNPFRPSLIDFGYLETFSPAITVQSPILCMREGTRKVFLNLSVTDPDAAKSANFKFKLSTEDAWISIPNEHVTQVASNPSPGVFTFEFTISPDFPPIAPVRCYDDEIETEIERINQCFEQGGLWISHEPYLGKPVAYRQIDLSVQVSGMLPMAIRNQEQVLDPKDNFQPFGLEAEPQSIYSFAHPELTHPGIKSIAVSPMWISKPEDITAYYSAYNKTEQDFKLRIKTAYKSLDGVAYTEGTNVEVTDLFADSITFSPINYSVDVNVPCGTWDTELIDPLEHNLYFQLELTPVGFGVSEYPLLMTQYSVDFAKYESRLFKFLHKKPTPVNMPYVPVWSQCSIDYVTAVHTWQPKRANQSIRVIENRPLGYQVYTGEIIDLGSDALGFFCVGIESVTKQSTGALYFDGTIGNTRANLGKLTWWYMSNIGWKDFTQYILIDETYGLTESGLFQWSIPLDFVNNNPLMPLGRFWLKATLQPLPQSDERSCVPVACNQPSEPQDALISIDGIYANTFLIKREAVELNETGNVKYLPAGSELSFLEATVDYEMMNPVRTSGEVKAESELHFWTRTFNRVRNRGRMVEMQDFEDLILRKYRELVLVKCNARREGSNRVNVVVINQQFYGDVPYSNAPQKSVRELQEIENYIKATTSPFFKTVIEPHVVNPCYREIGFLICIVFKNDGLKSENKMRLFTDLQAYVNPWLYQKHVAPKFGHWFDNGGILGYLQGLSYVEAVLDVKMGFVHGNELVFDDDSCINEDDILMLSEPTTIVAVDSINVFNQLGIGHMVIDRNFIVT